MKRFEFSPDRTEVTLSTELLEKFEVLKTLVMIRNGQEIAIEWVVDEAVNHYLKAAAKAYEDNLADG